MMYTLVGALDKFIYIYIGAVQVLHTCYYKLHVAVCISHSRAFLLNSYTTSSQQCNCLCFRRGREGERGRDREGGKVG